MARLSPPESASLEWVAQELSISMPTLERWRAEAIEQWRQTATQALTEPEDTRASHRETTAERRRIKERKLRRKDKALAETAALLVLSKNSR